MVKQRGVYGQCEIMVVDKKELSSTLIVNSEAKNRIKNALINGIFSLTTIEFRVLIALASQVPRYENDKRYYSIKITELGKLMKLNQKNQYAQIETACRGLPNKSINVECGRGRKKKSWLSVAWFDFIAYTEGLIAFRFAQGIQPYLTYVRGAYVDIPTQLLMDFGSFYGIRLFLLARQWYEIARRNGKISAVRKISIEEIKNLFVLEGKYKSSADLVRYVIEPAIKEVEKLTSLRISFTTQKTKTKITDIIITVSEVVDTVVADTVSDSQEGLARELLIKCQCNSDTISSLFRDYSFERIIRNARYTLVQKDVHSLAAYVRVAIKEDYNQEVKNSSVSVCQKQIEEVPALKTEEELIEETNKRIIAKKIMAEICLLSVAEQEHLHKDAIEYCNHNNPLFASILETKGFRKCVDDGGFRTIYANIIHEMRGCNIDGT